MNRPAFLYGENSLDQNLKKNESRPSVHFLSYSREDLDDVRLIARTLMAHGLKTWQDIHSLGTGLTEDKIKEAIRQQCDGLLFYSTQKSVAAAMIRDVELPEAEKRHKADSSFHIVPIFKLPIHETSESLKDCLTIPINNFNGAIVKNSILEASQRAAEIILKESNLKKELFPFPIGLVSKQKTGQAVGLDLDFNQFFESGLPTEDVWKTEIVTALVQVKNALVQKGITQLRLFAAAHLSLGFLFGYIFRDRTGFNLEILQNVEVWMINGGSEANPLKMSCSPGDLGSKNLVVKINLMSNDTTSIVSFLSSKKVAYRAMLDVYPPAYPVAISAKQAVSIAKDLANKIKELHAEYNTTDVHVFSAIPLGLALFIGHFANACGRIHCYEFVNSSREYFPSVVLENF